MSPDPAGGPEDARMDASLAAIAEPNRRAILRLIAEREMAAGQIAGHFAVTRPAISQHLAVLRDAGLIVERRDGARRLYRLRPEGLAGLQAFLGDLWPTALARFKVAAEASRDPEASPDSAASRDPNGGSEP